MEHDERARADFIDRHWDAVQRGPHRAAPARGGGDLTALIERLHEASGEIPRLFSDPHRAWRELGRGFPLETPAAMTTDVAAPIWITPNGRATLPMAGDEKADGQRGRLGWVLAQVATAALLVITLAAGYIAFVQRPAAIDESTLLIPEPATPEDERSFIPAASGVNDDTLFAAVITPEMLPNGDKEAIFYRVTLAPGSSMPYLLGPCIDHRCRDQIRTGVGAEVIDSGVYSLRLDAPLRVRRTGIAGAGETIPAGTEVILGAGDTVFYGAYEAGGEIRNAGEEPLEIVGLAILSTTESGSSFPALGDGITGEVFTRTVSSDWRTLPPGPIAVNLHRLTIPAETTLGPYDALGMEAMFVASGEIRRSLVRAGAEEPLGPAHPRTAGHAVPFIAAGSGIRHIVANAGDEPAEMLVLTIAPAGMWSGPLSP